MFYESEEKGIQPEKDHAKEALIMLKSVFDTKIVPQNEQKIWFEKILNETGI